MATYSCTACHKHWSYPVGHCIFCKGDVLKTDGTSPTVIGFTEVNIPSKGNERAPYFEYLLQDSLGNKSILKSYEHFRIGDRPDTEGDRPQDVVVGVAGSGVLGAGIAEYLLRRRYPVVLKTRSRDRRTSIAASLRKRLAKGHTDEQAELLLERLTVVTDCGDLAGCDIVVEAVAEDLAVKKALFEELSRACGPETILASNTSALSIDELAAATGRPDRCIGMHFFNPVAKMDLVEVVAGGLTSGETLERTVRFCTEIGKKPVVVKNSPGFVVNRLLLPQVNDAIRLWESGVARMEDVDAAMRLGLRHPMGPFALADLIGLDICLNILDTLYSSFGEERFRPAETLAELVRLGKLGVKSGEGFYRYGHSEKAGH